MRNFLVTKFVCSACGGLLKLTRKFPPGGDTFYGPYAEGEPTGSVMVDQAVGIVPCECVTKKLEAFQDAAKTIFNAGDWKKNG